jgi:hypothetical protein
MVQTHHEPSTIQKNISPGSDERFRVLVVCKERRMKTKILIFTLAIFLLVTACGVVPAEKHNLRKAPEAAGHYSLVFTPKSIEPQPIIPISGTTIGPAEDAHELMTTCTFHHRFGHTFYQVCNSQVVNQ